MIFEPLCNLIYPIGKRIKKTFAFLETEMDFKKLNPSEKHRKRSLVEYFNSKYLIVIYNDVRESYLEKAIYKFDEQNGKPITGPHGEYVVRFADIKADVDPGNIDKRFNNYGVTPVKDVINRCKATLIKYLEKHPEILGR